MSRILSGLGRIIITILKWIAKAVLTLFQLILELLKVMLLLFGLVAKIFLVFVKAGTP